MGRRSLRRRPDVVRLALVLALLAASAAFASDAEGVGAIYRLGTSARSLGWGGVSVAVCSGASGNPAALAWEEHVRFTSLYANGFADITHGALDFSAPWIGLSALFLDSGPIATATGTIRYMSQGLAAAVGVPIGPVGFGGRWRLARVSRPFAGEGWSLDAGVLLDLGALWLGCVWNSVLSRAMMYEGSSMEEHWTRDLALGVAWNASPIEDVIWRASIDVRDILNGPLSVVGGLEAWIGGLAARIGWDGRGPTFGLSAAFGWVEIDWAYAVRTDLGESHRVSLSVSF